MWHATLARSINVVTLMKWYVSSTDRGPWGRVTTGEVAWTAVDIDLDIRMLAWLESWQYGTEYEIERAQKVRIRRRGEPGTWWTHERPSIACLRQRRRQPTRNPSTTVHWGTPLSRSRSRGPSRRADSSIPLQLPRKSSTDRGVGGSPAIGETATSDRGSRIGIATRDCQRVLLHQVRKVKPRI